MSENEKFMLAVLIVKYQSQHDLRQTHLERTRMLEIASSILEEKMERETKKPVRTKLPF